MKKSMYLMAFVSLVFAACSNEVDPFGGEFPEGGQQALTFVFPGTAQGVVPYADPIASEDENEIQTLDAYVFGADKLTSTDPKYLLEQVVKMTKGGSNGLETVGQDIEATVKLSGKNLKKIYFVANGRSQATLDDYELGVTDVTAFVAKQTQNMGKGLVKCPLLMTGEYTVPESQTTPGEIELPGGKIDVTLTRRVARFDIINNAEESTFSIEKVQIRNARPGAFIFPMAGQTYAEALVEPMEIDFLKVPGANIAHANSVFYVYPTVVDGETYFDLKGISTQSGEKMVQPVKMQQKQTGTPDETKLLPIVANSRYIINILATGAATINANITVKEWVVGEQVDVEAGYGTVKMTLTDDPAPAGVALEESKKLSVPATATAAFGIDVKADTEWMIETAGRPAWITLTDEPAGGEVGKNFTIEINEANPGSQPREGILYIRNVKFPSIVQALTVVQAGNAAGFNVTGDKLVGAELSLFGGGDATFLDIALADPINDTFEVTTTDNWLTVTTQATRPVTRVTSTAGDKVVKVVATANPDQTPRTGTITLTAGGLTQTVSVVQAPKNLGSIDVKLVGLNAGKVSYDATAQTGKKLIVSAMTEWKVEAFEVDAQDVATAAPATWIANIGTPVITKPLINYNGTCTFDIEANATGAERKGMLVVTNTVDSSIKYSILVTQKAATPKPTFSVTSLDSDFSTPNFNITNAEKTATTFTVAPSNNEFGDLTIEQDEASKTWLTLGGTIAADGTFTLAATENADAERTATVTVTLAGAAAPFDIAVTQAGI